MNSTFLKAAPLVLAAGLALAGADAASAQTTISYSLGTYSFTTPNQYASFDSTARTSTVTLTSGVAQNVNIQGILFTVNDTNDFSGPTDYIGNVTRTLDINGIMQSAVQGFDLTTDSGDESTTFANDSLTFTPGTSSQVLTYNLGSEGTLKFTPGAIDTGDFFNEDSGEYISNIRGTFLLTAPAAVPEASSLVSTGVLLTLGLGAFALRSRKRSAAQLR